ncbi:hypothetical protein AB0910_17580 [Streptomyces sp. NPDC047002]|uniref:hypothetical protein n=1 Tax=Streptomyces sp. NPDC047002 TaxID=3155475 RepID=UPI003456C2A0
MTRQRARLSVQGIDRQNTWTDLPVCEICEDPRTTYAGSIERGSTVRVLWACDSHLNTLSAQVRMAEEQEEFLLGLVARRPPGRKPPAP